MSQWPRKLFHPVYLLDSHQPPPRLLSPEDSDLEAEVVGEHLEFQLVSPSGVPSGSAGGGGGGDSVVLRPPPGNSPSSILKRSWIRCQHLGFIELEISWVRLGMLQYEYLERLNEIPVVSRQDGPSSGTQQSRGRMACLSRFEIGRQFLTIAGPNLESSAFTPALRRITRRNVELGSARIKSRR